MKLSKIVDAKVKRGHEIHKKTIEALTVQIEGATLRGSTNHTYSGLRIAVLAIIQAHKLTEVEAQKVVDKIGLYVSKDDLQTWCRSRYKHLEEGKFGI